MSGSGVIIAGGGTGGHVFPGLAVAKVLRDELGVRVTFVGSRRGLESRIVPGHGFALELLGVEPIVGGGVSRAVRGSLVAGRETIAALRLLQRLRPAVVLSVGGYAAGPLSLAALLMRVPLAVLEPNAESGLTNRILLPFASRAYFGWRTPDADAPVHARDRDLGVPIREGFGARSYDRVGARRVLILGGSQGASALNRALPEAVATLRSALGPVEVRHQTGGANIEEVTAAYRALGLGTANVASFIDDVASAIEWADVVVARAGASTLAEIAAIGRAMILVPFPFAAGDHQAKNAAVLARCGAAISLPQPRADSATLAEALARILSDDPGRKAMADAARTAGRPDSAKRIAKDLLELLEQTGKGARGLAVQ